MNPLLLILVLTVATVLLVHYARGDRFAGPSSTTHPIDDLGPVEERRHLAPRR